MKLLYSPFSPFARKVRIVAHETGLQDRIEVVPTSTEDPASGLSARNPLNKIPVLETEFGPLYDSPVICEYLDTLHDGPKLVPAAGADRWRALRWEALADGLMDAALLIRYEITLRPADKQHEPWIERQKTKIRKSLDQMEADAAELDGPVTIGTIGAASALGYLDLRFADWGWRETHPRLAAWHAGFAERPSYIATIAQA
ncbi:MAG: glutathione S-transferase [Inquilinus limosus]|uniref:Glutathione S-transferase n=1 Tax=Inquilinus limosus TaxID=171674 RepID=A0A952FPW7_9PROT|nr:glutathione S-transferase [Inquilinus limosus]